MSEEAGDILLQAVFHAVMREERGSFNLTDVITGVCDKLITRHTHIFGKDKATDEGGALSVWEKNKMKEKHQDTFAAAVNDVPKVFPALLQAQKVAKRTEKGGWGASFESVEAELVKTLSELKSFYAGQDKEAVFETLGNALMCMAWLGRTVGTDCEEALLYAVKRAKNRYAEYEKAVLADGKDVNALTAEEWEKYYAQAKRSVSPEENA